MTEGVDTGAYSHECTQRENTKMWMRTSWISKKTDTESHSIVSGRATGAQDTGNTWGFERGRKVTAAESRIASLTRVKQGSWSNSTVVDPAAACAKVPYLGRNYSVTGGGNSLYQGCLQLPVCYTEVTNTCSFMELRRRIEKLRNITEFVISKFAIGGFNVIILCQLSTLQNWKYALH